MNGSQLLEVIPRVATRARRLAKWASLVAPTFVITLCAFPRPASAQLAVDRIDLVLDPASAAGRHASFSVTNKGSTVAQAVIRMQDWDRDSVGGNRFFPLGSTPGACARPLAVDPAGARLEPGASQDVRVSLDSTLVPAKECWTVVFVESAMLVTQPGGRRVNYVIRTGVKVYVVPAGAVLAGEVSDMRIMPHVAPALDTAAVRRASPSQPRPQSGPPAADSARQDLVMVFANTGTRHIDATGSVELRRADNSSAARIPLVPLHVLPGASERVTIPLPNLPAGRYVALAVIDFGGGELAAGQVEYEVR